jgi:sec-independent protein translocase protein TatA
MPGLNIGPLEIIIVLVIVVLLFGVGRIGKIGGELGKGIREFRNAVKDDDKKPADETKKDETKPVA